jgi:integrase
VQQEQKFEPIFLNAAEVEELAGNLDARHPEGLFLRVAAYTGLRAGEMQGLQLRDVNVLRRRIEVRRTLVRVKGGWREGSPKSEKSTRSVPIGRALTALLAEYLDEHPNAHEPTASLWPGRNYGGYGEWRGGLDWSKRMDYESFYRNRFRPAAAAIGYPELRFHDLRHTAASLFAGSGMKLERVAQVLGHSDTSTTYKVYLHFFQDDFDADMDRLDVYLERPNLPRQQGASERQVQAVDGRRVALQSREIRK